MKATFVGVGGGGVDSGRRGGRGGGRGGGRAAFDDADFVVVFLDAGAEGDAETVGHVRALVPGHGEDEPVGFIGVDLRGGRRGVGRRVGGEEGFT